ncbi:hypothetical protein [Draconibacterium halophilum]|uniref:Uncharacterized protein n=1 Tax=Draconibacterium halophilum TaxID=2706887 RepID=A0A6C0RI72_9BACT|nr:hypothetical protein [Draconibacterium halophilum]QIA08811.1 hypothetical protein G0Q07_14260 [Draconibacterium halophilum]QIA08828.1 hypothetical protein G0Q07_14355 [Draconibacterium halophilum]
MKKLLFIRKIKLDFNGNDRMFIQYQDIIDGELLSLKDENKGIQFKFAEELTAITEDHVIFSFWGDYKG